MILNVERKETNKSHDIWSGYEPPCVWRWIQGGEAESSKHDSAIGVGKMSNLYDII